MIEDNITDITTAPAEQPVPIIDEQTQQEDVAVTPDAPPPVEPEKPAVVLKDIDFFNKNVDWHNSNLAEGEKPLKKYKFAQDIPDEEYNGLKSKVEVGTLNEYNTLSTKYPEYKVGKAEKYEDINDENYTTLHNANKAQTELTRYNEIVKQLQNKRGLPKIKDRKDLTPELLGKAESAAVEDLNADMAKRSKKLGVEFKPFESFKAIDWDSVGNTYKLSSVKEANESISKLKAVYGGISPEIKKFPEFSSYEDFEKRKGDLVSLEKSASATKSKAEQNKFLEAANNQVASVNKELGANIPMYTDSQTAVSAFKPGKDGTIPFNKKVEEIQTTKGLEDFRNQISSIQPTGGARGDIAATNLATDNSPFNLEQKRKEYLAKYNERANNIAMLSKKTLKTGDNAPIFTDMDVALTSPYIKMAPMRPSPSVDANWLNREGKFGLGAPNIRMDEVSGRPIDPRVDELSELVSKTNKRSNEISVTLKSKVAEYNDYAKEIEGIQKSGVAITPDQKMHLDNLKEDVYNLRLGLDAMSSSAVSKYNNLFSIKKTQGSTAGDIARIAVGLPTDFLKVILQSISTAAPYLIKDFSQEESADVNKWLDKKASSLIQAISQSSPEHLQSAGTFMKGLEFSASMLPYMALGEVELVAGATASEALMLMSSFSSVKQSLYENPKTNKLSEDEKNVVALGNAIVSTATMSLGLKAGIKGKGNLGIGINNMTYNVFKKLPSTMSGVKTILSSALAGGVSFGTLDFASTVAGEGLNKIVNFAKGEEIYDKKSVYKVLGDAFERGAEGLFNGAFFGTIMGINAAVKGGKLNSDVFNAVDEMYSNPAAFNVAHNEIRRKLALGEITPKEAASQFKSITVFKDIMSQIPEDLNKADRYTVTKLLLENKNYEAQMSGLNESFAAQFKKRIENNNKEIEKIAASHIERTLSEKEAPTTEEGKPEAETTPVEPTEEQKAAKGRVDDFVEELATSNPDAHERAKEDPAPVIDELIESSKEKLDAAEPEEKAPIQEEIDRLEGIKKDVELGNEKPVEEPVEKQEANPLGEVSDSEHTEFIDTGKVDPKRLEDIANKVKNNEPLSDREKDIFTNKTAEVNNLIREQAEPKAEKSDPGGAKFTPELEAQMPQHKPMFSALKKGLAAIKSIMPNIDIRVHDTHESMQKVLDAYEVNGKDGKRRRAENVKGNYGVFKDGSIRIDFNLAAGANRITAAHELGHVILEKAFGDNPKMFDYLKKQVSSLVGETKNKYLLDFIKMYGESKKSNEYLTELAAIMGGGKIEPTVMRKVAAAINKIINKASLGRFSPFEDIKNSNELVNYFSSLSEALHAGKEIKLNDKYTPKEEPVSKFEGEDVVGGESKVGTFSIKPKSDQSLVVKAESVSNDSRDFIKDLVEDIDIREFEGKKFITNMYDYTNAGETDLGNGYKINLFGGKSYVPYMMSLNNKKIGDVSNLAAFNSKENAEGFVRNAEKSEAELFAPHSGTLGASWQFQQHTFAELVNLIVDKGIMSPKELINLFNSTISSKANKENFKQFKKEYSEINEGVIIRNFSSFRSDPKKIIDLLDIKNNYSPKLRKALNNAIASDKTFQKAIGVENKEGFFDKIMDPLNKGASGGEIIGVVKFDPKTFKIVETEPTAIDHHPSFGWTLLAKINGIYQPTEFHQSSSITDSYTKHNKSGISVSIKSEEKDFNTKNVASQAGASPKVAEFKIPKSKQSLVDDAKMTKDMTEDEKGNYLFYHYSPGKIPNIDPRHFGKNLRTGRDERPGIGVSMYYTRPDRRDVGGSYGYVVRVPKDKVYPFNSDPLNLMDKAKATFEKMYPGQAFDKNKQVAFVSQEAAKAGYDMTVAKWGNDLRAQTTKVMKGETYEKPHPDYHTSTVFNPKLEKYVANENKPKSKQSLVETEQRSRFEKSKIFAGVDKSISDAASSYKKKENLSDQTPDFVLSVSENDGKKIADAYEQMAHDPENPKVKQGFTELIGEIKKQAEELVSMGYKFELAKEGDGYNSDSKKMAKDVIENKRILVDPSSKSYGTKRTFDKDNMGLQDSGYKDANGVPMTNVELIRAVHDLFGHAEFGNGFGAAGEENAWRNHMSMFTPLAQKALTTTTRGQNSWVNFGPEMRNPDGSIKKKGDEGYLSPSERPFAEQKIGFLPDWAMENSYGDRVNVEGREVVPTNKHISEGKEVYEIDDIDAFYDAISAAKSSRGLDGIQVELKDKSKYQEILDKGGRFLITKDGKAGMMIEADGNTGSGFAHKDIPEGQNTLKPLLLTAIKLGARYTDAYDTYLPNYYSKFGFKVLNRIPFNKEFADKGWEKTILSQEPDVVTMYWDGGDRSKIEKNYGSFQKYEKNNGKVINDYDKAIEETKNKSNEIEEFASLVPPKIDKTKAEVPKSKQQLSEKGEEFKKEMQGFFDRNKDTGEKKDIIENAIADAEKKWAPWIRNNQEEYNSAVMGFKEDNGIKVKTPPSQAKISGEKPKKITVTERTALKDQIKLEIKAARDAAKTAAGERKAIGDKLNKMVGEGKITTKQAKILTDRFANVNTANPQMVKKFLDYAEKVFEDADYADKKANANSINRRIKKALKSSTHLPDILLSAAKNFASIPTNKVEDLSEHNDIGQKILDAVKSSGIRKLKDGNISDNTREAVKISDVNEYIDKANEYIESLPNDDIPEANEKVDNSEDINNYIKETFDGQKEAIKDMLDTGVSPDGERYDFDEDETRLIKKLLAIDLDKAGTQKSKERILEAMDHLLTNGDIGNIKYIVEDEYQSNVEIDEGTKTLIDLTKKKTLWAPIAAMRARAWNAVGEVKTDYQKTYQQLKYASVRRWDNIFKNFGGNEVFDKSLKKLAINYSAYNSRLKQFDTTRIQHKLIEKFNGSKRKLFDFNVRYTMYARQLEHENNPGNKKSLPAFDYIKATYDATGTQSGSMTTESRDRIKKLVQDNYFGDNKNPTAEQIDEFNKKFEDGDIQIDSKRLYDSFDKNEKIAIEKLQAVVKGIGKYFPRVAMMRGVNPTMFAEYHPIRSFGGPEKRNLLASELGTVMMNASTKAGVLEERTGKATPISLDPFSTINNATRDVLIDYYMSKPIKIVKKIMNNFEAATKGTDSHNIASAMNQITTELVDQVIGRSYTRSIITDASGKVTKHVTKFLIGKASRSVADFATNLLYSSIKNTKEISTGFVKHFNLIASNDLGTILENMGSYSVDRISPHGTMVGQFTDPDTMDIRIKDNAEMVSKSENAAYKLRYNAIHYPARITSWVMEHLSSTPDLAINRPLWLGTADVTFKKLTGKDIDFKKIKDKDPDYFERYGNEIQESASSADKAIADATSTKNPFAAAPKFTLHKVGEFSKMNNYLLSFQQQNFETVTDAVMHLYTGGKVSRIDAVRTIAAAYARAGVYKAVQKAGVTVEAAAAISLASMLGLLNDEDKDEFDKLISSGSDSMGARAELAGKYLQYFNTQDPSVPGISPGVKVDKELMTEDERAKKSWERQRDGNNYREIIATGVKQQMAQDLLNRSFGNMFNGVQNTAIEYMNMARVGEDNYDPYKDNLVRPAYPVGNDEKHVFSTVAGNMLGSYGLPIEAGAYLFEDYHDEMKSIGKSMKSTQEEINKLKSYENLSKEGRDKVVELESKKEKLIAKSYKSYVQLAYRAGLTAASVTGILPAGGDINTMVKAITKDRIMKPKDWEQIMKNYYKYSNIGGQLQVKSNK